jgi:hypothetical protein
LLKKAVPGTLGLHAMEIKHNQKANDFDRIGIQLIEGVRGDTQGLLGKGSATIRAAKAKRS